MILKREAGVLDATPATLPPAVKSKAYREQLRTRFCECLLARRILIVEGRTEYDAIPIAARRLHELDRDRFKSLESLGLAVINAETDSQIAPLAGYFKGLGKTVYAISDQQEPAASEAIEAAVDEAFESPESSFEKLILNYTDEAALRRYGKDAVDGGRWPTHLAAEEPADGMDIEALKTALGKFLKNNKGASEAATLVGMCTEAELPPFLVTTLGAIRAHCTPPPPEPEAADEDADDGDGATDESASAPVEAGPEGNEEAAPE